MKCAVCQNEKEEGKNYTYFYENEKKVDNRTKWICNGCVLKDEYKQFFFCSIISIVWFGFNWWLYSSGIMKGILLSAELFSRLIILVYIVSVGGSILLFIVGLWTILQGINETAGVFAAISADSNYLHTNNFNGKSKSTLLDDLRKRCDDHLLHNRYNKLLDDSNKILMIESSDDYAIRMRDIAISKIK
jgi:hypothetical protein